MLNPKIRRGILTWSEWKRTSSPLDVVRLDVGGIGENKTRTFQQTTVETVADNKNVGVTYEFSLLENFRIVRRIGYDL